MLLRATTLQNTSGPQRRWRLIWKPALRKLTEMPRSLLKRSEILLEPRGWRRSRAMQDCRERVFTRRFLANVVQVLTPCSELSRRLGSSCMQGLDESAAG